jgi:hypothetical protein
MSRGGGVGVFEPAFNSFLKVFPPELPIIIIMVYSTNTQ